MSLSRETYYAALEARLRDKVDVAIVTRRNLTSEDLTSSAMQPALVLRVTGSVPFNDTHLPPIWSLGAVAIIYARNSTKDGSVDAVLNGLVDQVEAALELQAGERSSNGWQTTLGGVVEKAWIDGEVEFIPGDVGDQAAAIVPIEMQVTEPAKAG